MAKKELAVVHAPVDITSLDELCRHSIDLIRYARGLAVQQINIIELMTNYSLGKWIVEVQQNGTDRAQYGAHVIDRLSSALTEEFGKGYSRETLRNARKFYLTYQDRISQTLFTEFAVRKSQTLFAQSGGQLPFTLPWSHYLLLMRIKDKNERRFYEIEATKEVWSIRTLQRQYHSSLYERLALSKDKEEVIRLAS